MAKATARKRRRSRSTGGSGWVHEGGGCFLAAPGEPYACDDDYTHVRTGLRVTVLSTQAAHFRMPSRVRNLRQLKTRKGVNPVLIFRGDGAEE